MENRASLAQPFGVYRFELLSRPGVAHGVTRRVRDLPAEGDVSFVTAPHRDVVHSNRSLWAQVIGVDATSLVCGQQVHGTRVTVVRAQDVGRGAGSFEEALPETDGLVTGEPGVPLTVFCADCVPVLLYDPINHIVAAIHAGWRGTVQGVVGEAIRTMHQEFSSDPGAILAGVGPSIGPCCYEVGPEVIDAWYDLGVDPDGSATSVVDGGQVLDLWRANELVLEQAGVSAGRVETAGVCTRCHAGEFFSHRAGLGHPGRFAAIIALSG